MAKAQTEIQEKAKPPVVEKPNAAQQASCAQQARAFFANYEKRMGPPKDDTTDREFTNHFDPKNQACYIHVLITGMRFGKNFGTQRFVSDVNEDTTLADYVGIEWAAKSRKVSALV